MSKRLVICAAALGAPLAFCELGCGDSASFTVSPSETQYSVALTVNTPSDLPQCTVALGGTVAYVNSPPSLWACAHKHWTEIACTADVAGNVAYESTTNTLWACVQKQWTQVALPPGPPGPRGAPGHDALLTTQPEPAGAHCPAGGHKVQAGTDANRDDVLQPSEVSSTSYLCNGEQGPAGPAGPEGPPGQPGDGGSSESSDLVVTWREPPGDNCESGGVLVRSGIDTNGDGSLADSEVTKSSYLCDPPGWIAVAAGGTHACAIKRNGMVACWGNNDEGQASPQGGTFAAISAGSSHTCGIRRSGTVDCWGEDSDGEASAPAGRFTAVDLDFRKSCGLKEDGTVVCWGWLGVIDEPPAATFTDISTGIQICGLKANGTALCWGAYGMDVPTQFPPITFDSISAGFGHTCGIRRVPALASQLGAETSKRSGPVICWGDDYLGQTEVPSETSIVPWGNLPVEFEVDPIGTAPIPITLTSIAAGRFHTCGIRENGKVVCWGDNKWGQTNAPAGTFIAVSAGGFFTCGIKTDGTLVCWGSNSFGELNVPHL